MRMKVGVRAPPCHPERSEGSRSTEIPRSQWLLGMTEKYASASGSREDFLNNAAHGIFRGRPRSVARLELGIWNLLEFGAWCLEFSSPWSLVLGISAEPSSLNSGAKPLPPFFLEQVLAEAELAKYGFGP